MSDGVNNGDGTVTYTCSECGEVCTEPMFSMAAMNGYCRDCFEIHHSNAGDRN